MQNQAIQVKLMVTPCQIEDVVVGQLLWAHVALGGRWLLNRLCLVWHLHRGLHLLRRDHLCLTHEKLFANWPLFLLVYFLLFLGLLCKQAVPNVLNSYRNPTSAIYNHRFLLSSVLFLLFHKFRTVEFYRFYLAHVSCFAQKGFDLFFVILDSHFVYFHSLWLALQFNLAQISPWFHHGFLLFLATHYPYLIFLRWGAVEFC
jgi:hypothetical protein